MFVRVLVLLPELGDLARFPNLWREIWQRLSFPKVQRNESFLRSEAESQYPAPVLPILVGKLYQSRLGGYRDRTIARSTAATTRLAVPGSVLHDRRRYPVAVAPRPVPQPPQHLHAGE